MTQHYFLVVLHDLELGEPDSLLAGTADISSALRSMNLFCMCKPIDEERVFLLVPEATRFPPFFSRGCIYHDSECSSSY